MVPSKSISVLGCGWLGLPLARYFIQLGFTVKGSTTNPAKVSELQANHIKPFLLNCDPLLRGPHRESFFESKILLLNIPFKRTLMDPRIYKQQIESVVKYAEDSPVEFIIFASSTSVYPDDIGDAHEDLNFEPSHPRSQILFEIEMTLLQSRYFSSTVIRFGGLCGASRRIGQFLGNKKNLEHGESPVNLIHRDDCISIVEKIIERDRRGEIFNACCDEHPTRRELYTKTSLALGLSAPEFMDTRQTRIKVVSNHKLKERLGYIFKYPNPLEFP